MRTSSWNGHSICCFSLSTDVESFPTIANVLEMPFDHKKPLYLGRLGEILLEICIVVLPVFRWIRHFESLGVKDRTKEHSLHPPSNNPLNVIAHLTVDLCRIEMWTILNIFCCSIYSENNNNNNNKKKAYIDPWDEWRQWGSRQDIADVLQRPTTTDARSAPLTHPKYIHTWKRRHQVCNRSGRKAPKIISDMKLPFVWHEGIQPTTNFYSPIQILYFLCLLRLTYQQRD